MAKVNTNIVTIDIIVLIGFCGGIELMKDMATGKDTVTLSNCRTKAVEWVYTLKKSIIEQAFDQSEDAKAIRHNPSIIPRNQCIDKFLWWARTNEGFGFWSQLSKQLDNE